MISRIKKLFNRNKDRQEEQLELIGEYGNHKFYLFKDALTTICKRQKVYAHSLMEANRKITDEDLSKLSDDALKAAKAGNLIEFAQIMALFNSLVNQDWTTSTLIKIANCIILVDDEPIDQFTMKHAGIKAKCIQESEMVEDFFLRHGIATMRLTNEPSENTKIWDYLKSPKCRRIESLFGRAIGRPIFKNLYPI